jgi:hypothetical protein
MAVNENLYSWMLKTYGMGAAEWYRNNPTSKPGANPYLPKGAYVPQAQKGPRGETFASVSPDIVEASVIEAAPKTKTAAEKEADKFQNYYNQSKQQLGISDQSSDEEYYAGNDLYYNPSWGQYGSYYTKKNPDLEQVARVRDMMARQAAGTADPSWANQDLSNLIQATGKGGWHVRGATENDPEVQKFGIYNVGRSDYMQSRRNEAIQKNIEILQQQANDGNQSSQDFLDNYVQETPQETESAPPEFGPRGEGIDENAIAAEYGAGFPKQPKWIQQLEREYQKVKDKPFSPGTPKPGRGMGDTWEGPVREAQAPAFDEQKALIARQAADEYRRRGQVEDPFRSGSFG